MCCDKDGTSSGCAFGRYWAADDPRGKDPVTDSEGSTDEGEVIETSDDDDEDEEEDEGSDEG